MISMTIAQFLIPRASKAAIFEIIIIAYLYSSLSLSQSSELLGTSLASMCYTGYSECFRNPSESREIFNDVNKTATEYANYIESEKSSPILYALTFNIDRPSNPDEPVPITSYLLLGAYWYLLSCAVVWLIGLVINPKKYKQPADYLFQNEI
jgi:hypothetical protein